MGSFKCIPHDVAKCIPHDVTSSSISILPYFNRLGGSTRSWRLRIFVQVVSTMVSYCFFSVKRLGRTKLFGLACKKTTLFVDFSMKLVEASYASECRRFCRVFYNTCFCFFRFRLEPSKKNLYSALWRIVSREAFAHSLSNLSGVSHNSVVVYLKSYCRLSETQISSKFVNSIGLR